PHASQDPAVQLVPHDAAGAYRKEHRDGGAEKHEPTPKDARLSRPERSRYDEDGERNADENARPVIGSVTDPELAAARAVADRPHEDNGEDIPDDAERRPRDPAECDQPPASGPFGAAKPRGDDSTKH